MQGRAGAHKEVFPGQRAGKMAAPMELFCWSGGWGLPSVDLDSLAVLVRGGAGALCCALMTREGAELARHPNFAGLLSTGAVGETEAVKDVGSMPYAVDF